MIPKARLRYLRSLRRRKVRRAEGVLLLEGSRAVEDALLRPGPRTGSAGGPAGGGARVREILIGPEAAATPRGRALAKTGAPVTLLDEREVGRLSETRHPAGVFALVENPCRELAGWRWVEGDPALALVADGVADPGNLGTLIRTAAALEAAAVVVTRGSVEPTNPKTVRATAGALFRVPVLRGGLETLEAQGFRAWVADAGGETLEPGDTRPPRLALVVGNEPRGVRDEVRARADRCVAVPLRAGVESLNVAVAAGILLDRLRSLEVRRA